MDATALRELGREVERLRILVRDRTDHSELSQSEMTAFRELDQRVYSRAFSAGLAVQLPSIDVLKPSLEFEGMKDIEFEGRTNLPGDWERGVFLVISDKWDSAMEQFSKAIEHYLASRTSRRKSIPRNQIRAWVPVPKEREQFQPDGKTNNSQNEAEITQLVGCNPAPPATGERDKLTERVPPIAFDSEFHELQAGIDLKNDRIKWRNMDFRCPGNFLLIICELCKARTEGIERCTMRALGNRNSDLNNVRFRDAINVKLIDPQVKDLIKSPPPNNTRYGYELKTPSEILKLD